MKAIQVATTGGPQQLVLVDAPTPTPAPGEVRIAVHYAGVNFLDVYQRSGLYPKPLPFTPGNECAGRVDAVGAGVTGVAIGDRVACAAVPGCYAEYVVCDAARVVRVRDGVSLQQAAAVLLQGLTAQYLTTDSYRVARADVAVVHAAAGGVGRLLLQRLRAVGAHVVAVVGSASKATVARDLGAQHVAVDGTDDFVAIARSAGDGRGAHVVYDSVGQSTFARSLAALRARGMLVSFGQSSGPVPPFELGLLQRSSLFLTRPALHHYVERRDELDARAADVFAAVADGRCHVHVDAVLPLAQAAEAHRRLEARTTIGKLLLHVRDD